MSVRGFFGNRRTARGTRRLGFESLEGRIVLSGNNPVVADVAAVASDVEEVAPAVLEPIEIAWVRSLSYALFSTLDAEQATYLTTAQIASIPDVWWFSRMSDEARGALGPVQVQSLNTATIRLSYLTPTQVGWLTPGQVRALTHPDDFRFITAAQVPNLTASQMALIPDDGAFSQWPAANRAALYPAQVHAIRVQDVRINWLPAPQVSHLTTAQIRALNRPEDFRLLSPAQTPELTTAQIALIPDDHSLYAWPEASRAALTSAQVQALRVETVRINRLTLVQVGYLLRSQVQALTDVDDYHRLQAWQVPQLLPSQVAKIASEDAFFAWPEANRNALTGPQVTALNVGAVRINRLTAGQIAWLTQAQVRSIAVVTDLALLPETKIQFVTGAQIAMIPDEPTFAAWSSSSRAALSGAQVTSLNVAKVRINRLTAEQIAWLTQFQVQSLTNYADFKLLPPSKVQFLTPAQIRMIPNEPEFAAWSEESRAALAGWQVRYLNVGAVRINRLTPGQIAWLAAWQVQSLTNYADFKLLPATKIQFLTAAQVALVPDEPTFAAWPTGSRAALNEAQVRALRVADVRINRLTPTQVGYLSLTQIRLLEHFDFQYLTESETPSLSPAQIARIPNEHAFYAWSEAARAALMVDQVQALNVAAVRINLLTVRQLESLTPAQVQSINGYYDFPLLTSSRISYLSAAQIARIPDYGSFSVWPAENRAALTPLQVQALRVNTVGLGLLTRQQVQWVTESQIQTLGMHEFKYLYPGQIPTLTPTQFASIDSVHILPNLTHESQARLTREQLMALRPDILSYYMGDKPTQTPPANYHLSTEAPLGPDGLPATSHALDEAGRAFALVPAAQATHVTVGSGAWSDPAIWRDRVVPAAGAKVLISAGTTVTFNASMNFAIKTLRIDGTLTFATDVNTQLKADTIVVFTTGVLQVGTAANPIQNHVNARIVIADNGAIDRTWDPYSLSRGLISRGRVEMHGESVTPFVKLAIAPRAGATQLLLSAVPSNWQVGDSLVLAGTDPAAPDFQTERRIIRAISGNLVTIDALRYDHVPPAGYGLSVYVANETRNIQIRAENASAPAAERPHMMFMHNPAVTLANIGVYGFGRTNKLLDINDPVVVGGVLQAGTGTNPRARYAVHFHHTGVNGGLAPASVSGSIVVNSEGWGFVNHQSNVNMDYNVAVDVVGSGFVGEDGNEIGRMSGNLSINMTGSGQEIDDREANHDFGHSGHGFWLQGPGIALRNNISAANRDAAYVFFTSSSKSMFETANLDDESLGGGRAAVPVGSVPLAAFVGNEAFASRAGVELWRHQQNLTSGATKVIDFTTWNTRSVGVDLHYSGQVHVEDSVLLGDLTRYSAAVGIRANISTNDLKYTDNVIAGFDIGVIAGSKRENVIEGGSIAAVQRVVVYDKFDTTRTVDIRGIAFPTLNATQLNGRTPYTVYVSSYVEYLNRSLETLTSPDRIRYWFDSDRFMDLLYFEQAASYIPFPSSEAGERVPPQYRDKTNLQLWTQYRIAYNGGMLPAGASRPSGFYALTPPTT